MSLVNALQNGQKVTSLPTNANVTINTGDGHSTIKVTAKNASIDTGCGDQDITAIVSNDLSIDTGLCGEDKINAVVGGNAEITTREDNDIINLQVGGNFAIEAGMNHPECGAEEDDDIVLVKGNLDKTDGQNYVSTGQGKDNVRIIANNVDVKKADGELVLGFFGDDYNVNSDASKNTIGFWGDNVDINITGRGPQDIKTLDFSFEEGKFTDFGFEDLLEQETYMGSSYDTVVTEKLTGKDNLDEVAGKYNLTDAQKTQLRELDLTKQTAKGNPYYLLYKKGDNYEIGYRDDKNNVYTLDGKKVTTSSSKTTTSNKITSSHTNKKGVTTVTGKKTTTTTTTSNDLENVADLDVEREKEVTTETTKTDYYNINGVKNVNINFLNNGKYNVGITASDGYVNINGQNACNNDIVQNIVVRGGYIVKDSEKTTDVSKIMEKLSLSAGDIKKNTKTTSSSSTYSYKYKDPLILDTNKDGMVSTIKTNTNYGIDITGNGIADGAATGGDKMLAMSDLNKNGKIDGAEVFGNETVSPFTGKKLNAANGFEALKQIAQEAKEYTGIDCMNGSKVDVQKLQKALAKIGVNLGFVSDDNVKDLENLYGVKE
ncbi:hypothetical protein IJS77_02725, partial [bacterium]|nr:hypothetical protein [bacterium]